MKRQKTNNHLNIQNNETITNYDLTAPVHTIS